MRSLLCLLLLLLMAALSIADPVSAQDISLADIFPELKDYPAPPWVRVGTQLTYYTATAAIPAHRDILYDREQSRWRDGSGGSYEPMEATSAASAGLLQVNVAALAETVALDIASFLYLDGRQTLTSLNQRSGGLGPPGAAGDFWLPVPFLEQLPDGEQGRMQILRMPYVLEGTQYQAIRFHYDDGKLVYMYDLETGVLLYHGYAGTSQQPHTYTQDLQPAMTTTIVQSHLVHRRDVSWPWQMEAPPYWLQTIRRLEYTGTVTVHVPGSPSFPMELRADIDVRARGPNWLQYERALHMGAMAGVPMLPVRTTALSTAAGVGGFWLPPNGLSQLAAGEVIDSDPVSGVVICMVGRTPAADGGSLVHIREEGPGGTYSNDFYFDQALGMLTAAIHNQYVLHQTHELYLSGMEP